MAFASRRHLAGTDRRPPTVPQVARPGRPLGVEIIQGKAQNTNRLIDEKSPWSAVIAPAASGRMSSFITENSGFNFTNALLLYRFPVINSKASVILVLFQKVQLSTVPLLFVSHMEVVFHFFE
jgi:hypothetical protein